MSQCCPLLRGIPSRAQSGNRRNPHNTEITPNVAHPPMLLLSQTSICLPQNSIVVFEPRWGRRVEMSISRHLGFVEVAAAPL